jgi:hypothetical protein
MSKIAQVLYHDQLPVDVRHNSKINREALSAWATGIVTPVRVNPPQPPAPSP